jgi:hypothetical protein
VSPSRNSFEVVSGSTSSVSFQIINPQRKSQVFSLELSGDGARFARFPGGRPETTVRVPSGESRTVEVLVTGGSPGDTESLQLEAVSTISDLAGSGETELRFVALSSGDVDRTRSIPGPGSVPFLILGALGAVVTAVTARVPR